MNKYAEQVTITIEGFTRNVVYYDFKFEQKMADHHYFSFVWQYTSESLIAPDVQAAASKKYMASEMIVTFKGLDGTRLMAKGKIIGLDTIYKDGSPAGLHVYGVSHTIALDEMGKSRTFLDKSLQDIALKIFPEAGGEFYQMNAIKPTYNKIFDYKAQYNETSFEFLKRLAIRYGQWYYWDGMRIQFGQTKQSKITIINNASLHNFKISVRMASHKTSFTGYDYKSAGKIRDSKGTTNTGTNDSFATNIRYNQAGVAQPELGVAAYTNNAQDATEIAEMVKLQTAGKDANSVFYSGTSYLPIGVGQVFIIQNKNIQHELIAIEVTHHSEVHGNYTCEFKAIPADVTAPHYTDVTVFARAESQPATVRDNNDPEGLGRVKVAFYWGQDTTTSEWMRLLQPHTGGGKGHYFIPEKGEEVLVGFEGSNVDCPYVMGMHYNGNEKSGYATATNDFKVIKTSSGHHLTFEELKNITLADKKGNAFHIDSTGDNINITALETITLTAKNINLNATEDVNIRADRDISIGAGNDIDVTAGNDLRQTAEGEIREYSDKRAEIADKKTERQSGSITTLANEISIFSEKEYLKLESGKSINANSIDKTQMF